MLIFGKMAPTSLTARFKQSVTPASLRAYLAEFISTFFYVFAVVGSAMASSKCWIEIFILFSEKGLALIVHVSCCNMSV